MPQILLEASHISLSFGQRQILAFDQLELHRGDRVGIVGQNGSGKTTLLRILTGKLLPEEGHIRRYVPVTYMEQFGRPDQEIALETLSQLGVRQQERKATISGGEETRLRMAAAFSTDTPLLFCDEPTSNLDDAGVRWFLARMQTVESFVLVSHDRYLLDTLCNRIIEVKDGTITCFSGGYSAYLEERTRKFQFAAFEYDQYQQERKRLTEALRGRDQKAQKMKKAPARMGNSEARLHRRAATEKQEKLHNAKKAIESRLERLEVKERPKDNPKVSFDFSLTDPPANKIVLSGEGITFGYDSSLLYHKAAFVLPRGSKTALWGPNGCGKSTLLKLIIDEHPSIRKVPKATLGYFPQDLSHLDPEKTVLENAMADAVQSETAMRTMLARLLLGRDFIDKKTALLSGGERMKLAFAKLFGSRANVLLLDEPTNYLDIGVIEALQEIVREYQGTILFVSHDRTFVDAAATRLLLPKGGRLQTVEGGLKALEHPQPAKRPDMSRAVLELRFAEVIARLSDSNCPDKAALEAEFEKLSAALRQSQKS